MKHAYLILAHNEFEVTKRLLQALDDPRNDVFIHFDKKLEIIPSFELMYARLYVLTNRMDVRWGDVSVVEAEFELFEAAQQQGDYRYYHLLSGVDMPLKSQDQIHDFFTLNQGKEFIGYSQYDYKKEVVRKVNRQHLFTKDFRANKSFVSMLKRICRAIFLRFQEVFGIYRNGKINFKKGTQWVSLTHDFVTYLIKNKGQILPMYLDTFCADEIFIQTLCWNSSFRSNIFKLNDESEGSMRLIGWRDGVLYDWKNEDFEELISSNLMFARKFNTKHIEVVNRLLKNILLNKNA